MGLLTTMLALCTAAAAPTASAAATPTVPTVTLNNGVLMPRLATSLPSTAADAKTAVAAAFAAGVTHFVTANDYLNQAVVGDALRALGVPRASYFVTTMTSPCQCSQGEPHCDRNITDLRNCTDTTVAEVLSDLDQLGLDYADLVLLHGPNLAADHVGGCTPEACAANRAQWIAYEQLVTQGKVRAIGVGNFCPSCLECLLSHTVPAVNQVQYHVAYGSSGAAFVEYFASKGIVPWAYEPLSSGAAATNALCGAIGAAHNKSAAQVAMRWITSSPAAPGFSLLTKASNPQYLREDIDVFDGWDLSAAERAQLDAVTCGTNPELCTHYDGRMCWGCTV